MTQNDEVRENPEELQSEKTAAAELESSPEVSEAEETVEEITSDPETPEASTIETNAEIEQLKAALAEAQAKADENWDRVLRMQADMDNTRKRLRQETDNARKFGQTALIEELLPICDSMEMGLKAANEENAEIEKIREGYALTSKMLEQMLLKFNVEQIDPLDQKFDPERHQAMSMQEGTGKEPNTVVAVMQKGYTLNDRLIRPALVMVAK